MFSLENLARKGLSCQQLTVQASNLYTTKYVSHLWKLIKQIYFASQKVSNETDSKHGVKYQLHLRCLVTCMVCWGNLGDLRTGNGQWKFTLNSSALGDVIMILKVYCLNVLVLWNYSYVNCTRHLMTSHHLFRYWLGVIRQQAITWAHGDPNLCCLMASLGHNELISMFSQMKIIEILHTLK